MPIAHLLFALLILMGAVCATICCIEATPNEQGLDHPRFPPQTMQKAPDGPERHQKVVVAGGAFGVLTAFFTGASLVLGLGPHGRRGLAPRVVLSAAAVYAALFCLVVVLYWKDVQGPVRYILGFPASTAAMLFLATPFPILSAMLYAIFFPRWIMSPADEEAFRALVARRRTQRAD